MTTQTQNCIVDDLDVEPISWTTRITRTPTLDGGVAYEYGGMNYGDQTWNISLILPMNFANHLELNAKAGQYLYVSSKHGCFIGMAETFSNHYGRITFSFNIKEKG